MALNQDQHSIDAGLLDAQLELWHNTFAYVKSMALKSALDLGIPDAIHHHGAAATLTQIVTKVTLHPSKIPCLRRLMRVLTITGIFSVQHPADGGEPLYGLTPASRLLVGGSPNLTPILTMLLHNIFITPFLCLGTWFQHELPDPSVFKMTHGQTIWEMADHDAAFDALINNRMVSDSRFLMDIAIRVCGDVFLFQGITSLIDVAGGLGGAAQAISKAFPHVKCTVLDLAHVVAKAPSGTDVQYIAGDMFESVPPANAVFLKWVLHDWGDAECVKILKNCKKAIPTRDAGGKVIILDMVVGAGPPDLKHRETQVLFDLFIMFVNGIERDEQEWKKIIFEAGFSEYKITPVLGVRSIIEWVLHGWGDAECVKKLKNCKKAIPARDAGGKVIIVDMVVGAGPPDVKHRETQVLSDLLAMLMNGIQRDEQEWKKIIFEARFSEYKITPVLGAGAELRQK